MYKEILHDLNFVFANKRKYVIIETLQERVNNVRIP